MSSFESDKQLSTTTDKMRMLREKLAEQTNAMKKGEPNKTIAPLVKAETQSKVEKVVGSGVLFDIEKERISIGKLLMALMETDEPLYKELQGYVKDLFQVEKDGFRAYKSQNEFRGTELASWRKILQEILDTRPISESSRHALVRCLEGR